MTAQTADRLAKRRNGDQFSDPVAAGKVIYAGAMYAIDASGNAVPASATTGAARAVAVTAADNSAGAAGAVAVAGERGVFQFNNSAVTAIARADIGAACYLEDDNTVAKTAASGAKTAGTIVDVDDGGVWVRVG